MTTAMRRSVVLIAAATTLVAGCSTGQGDPTVAVTVGGVSVSTVDQVQQQLNDLLSRNQQAQEMAQQRKLDQVARGIVTQDVLHALTADAARQQGITVDESLVNQLAPILTAPPPQQGTDADPGAQLTSIVNGAFNANDVARDKVLQMELGRKVAGTVSVVMDAAVVSDQNEARSLANQIAQHPDQATKLVQGAKSALQDPFVDKQFGGSQDTSVDTLMSNAVSPFMYIPVGSVLMWRLPGDQGGYAVIFVKQRTIGKPGADISQANPLQLADVGKTALMTLAMQRGVTPNQRYGTWDLVGMQVVAASEAATGSFVLPPTNAKQ